LATVKTLPVWRVQRETTNPFSRRHLNVGPSDASLPAYEDVVAAYNARVSAFGRVWARVTAVYRGVDDAGNRLSEQAEGHLQIERPDRVALSLGKLGETYLYLGSNESRYWWIDLVDAAGRPVLRVTRRYRVRDNQQSYDLVCEQVVNGADGHDAECDRAVRLRRRALTASQGGLTLDQDFALRQASGAGRPIAADVELQKFENDITDARVGRV